MQLNIISKHLENSIIGTYRDYVSPKRKHLV